MRLDRRPGRGCASRHQHCGRGRDDKLVFHVSSLLSEWIHAERLVSLNYIGLGTGEIAQLRHRHVAPGADARPIDAINGNSVQRQRLDMRGPDKFLLPFRERKPAVFQGKRQFGRGVAVRAKAEHEPLRFDVLETDAPERTVLLPRLVAREIVVQETLRVLDAAVPYCDRAGVAPDLDREIRIIGEEREHLAPAGSGLAVRTGNPIGLGQRIADGILGRSPGAAVFDQNAAAAETERAAGGVEPTAVDVHVFVVEAGYAVIAHLHRAIGDLNAVADGEMHAVVTSENRQVLKAQIGAPPDIVRPVSGVADGVAAENAIRRIVNRYSVDSAEMLFADGIVAVAAVDLGAGFADDAHVARPQHADDRVVPAACALEDVVVRLALPRRDPMDARGEIPRRHRLDLSPARIS